MMGFMSVRKSSVFSCVQIPMHPLARTGNKQHLDTGERRTLITILFIKVDSFRILGQEACTQGLNETLSGDVQFSLHRTQPQQLKTCSPTSGQILWKVINNSPGPVSDLKFTAERRVTENK